MRNLKSSESEKREGQCHDIIEKMLSYILSDKEGTHTTYFQKHKAH